MSGRRGVTLVELLVAVTLVSLMSVGILFAIRIGMNTMERTNARFLEHRRALGAQRILENQVAGMLAVPVTCGGDPRRSGPVFFQGEPEALRFVSRYTLEEAGRGYPRILEFMVIPGAQGRGVRLVVNELHYTGPYSIAMLCGGGGGPVQYRPVQAGPSSFVLADGLATCRMSYLVRNPVTRELVWTGMHYGPLLPEAIRFEMPPLASMVLRVRVDRVTNEPYVDIEEQ